jgi:DMSO/TMAO reductase YedYZ molybdopterin-dependent catalytic subunit
MNRRELLKNAAAGTLVVGMGGAIYRIASDELSREAMAQKRSDGKPRLPPGQRVIEALRPMGGEPGSSDRDKWKLRVYGEVDKEWTLTFKELLALPQVRQVADVHCVTSWSVLGSTWTGVRLKALAEAVGLKSGVRHVIFEGAHGYSANVPLSEALRDDVLVTHALNDRPIAQQNGAPVRALVPDLYFWKSAKWLTGIRFVTRDQPGYWETRGYHNHGDPWREERYG